MLSPIASFRTDAVVRDNEQKQASLERYKRYVKVSQLDVSDKNLKCRPSNFSLMMQSGPVGE